jgi:hypothetical protein
LCSGSRVAEICNTVAKLLGPNKDGGRGRYSLHRRKDERHAINNYAKSELHEYAGIYVHGLSFISDGTFRISTCRHTLKACLAAAQENSSFSAIPDSPPAENFCRNTMNRFSSADRKPTFEGVSWMIQNAAIDSSAVKLPANC